MKMKCVVKAFDDISEIHQEGGDYSHCIRVDFETECPPDNEAAEAYWQHCALVAVFGDLSPSDLEFDWRDELELWLRYNLGESKSTLRPLYPFATRTRLLSMNDVAQLQDFDDKDMAEWLEHFHGYPQPGNMRDLKACEVESFIGPDDNGIYIGGQDFYEFDTEEEAYFFFIANYHELLNHYNIALKETNDDNHR